MDRIYKRPAYLDYEEALKGFTDLRKTLNEYIENEPKMFAGKFAETKKKAGEGDLVAMDILAYYYKTGVPDLLPENYEKYLKWEIVAAARGNELAIEKLQFLLGYAYTEIMESEDYETIEYKNGIDDYNVIYVIGKNICKMLVREMSIFPTDMAVEEDEYKPYTQEQFVHFRETIDKVIPKTIDFMKS